MIIDIHVHMFQSWAAFPKRLMEHYFETKKRRMGEKAFEKEKPTLDSMGRAEMLIKDMDEAGVDMSVISPVDWGSAWWGEESEISIWRTNEYVAESQAKYPNRIIGFVGVNPLRNDAVVLLKKAITEWGLKGAKILQLNFRVTDEAVQPFMTELNELGIPVLIHQGTDSLPILTRNCNPEDLDWLTLKYPRIKIIAAHLGRGYENLLAAIIKYRPGVIYTDICGIMQRELRETPWHALMRLRYFMDTIPNSVLMGSDWPFIKSPPEFTHKEWFDSIRNLKIPEQVLQLGLGIKDFSQEEKNKILGENARALLGI
jgi:predicted TIM-barrel fold metal-dependent hydrolase